MSVTFSPTYVETAEHTISCGCGASTNGISYASYGEAYQALLVMLTREEDRPRCGDDFCFSGNPYAKPLAEIPSVNVSNHNAKYLLDNLGWLPEEESLADRFGELSADDFAGRIYMALLLAPTDEGMPSYELPKEHEESATFIQGGRPAGYLQDRLQELLTVVEYCRENSLLVNWG